MDQHLVLIADVEGSKQLGQEARKATQEGLQHTLSKLNDNETTIISQYSITMGDEFQAVLGSPKGLFDDIWTILAALHPVKIRFSVAVGTIATAIQKEKVLAMDGPAFHAARDGIIQMKEDESLFRVSLEKQEPAELKIINNSLALLSKEIRSWNRNRILMQHLIRKGMDYKKVSQTLGLSERSFYKNKEAASLDLVNALFNNIQEYIDKQLQN